MGCGCGSSSSNTIGSSTGNTHVSLGEAEIDELIVQAARYIAILGDKLATKKKLGEMCDECIQCLDIMEEMVMELRCFKYPVPGTITIIGGNATSWSVYVDGVLVGTAAFTGATTTIKAQVMTAAINALISDPDYIATSSANIISINPVVEVTGELPITFVAVGGVVDATVTDIINDGCWKLTEIKKNVDYFQKVVYK